MELHLGVKEFSACTSFIIGNAGRGLQTQQVMVDDISDLTQSGVADILSNNCYFLLTDKNITNQNENIPEYLKLFKKKPDAIVRISENNEKLQITEHGGAEIPQITILIGQNIQVHLYLPKCKEVFTGVWSRQLDRTILKNSLGQKMMNIVCSAPRTIRIAFNDYQPRFELKNNEIDKDTSEGILVSTFLEHNNIRAKFINGNGSWGSYDDKKQLWNGVVGEVGYGRADVGVSYISHTQQRNSFISYSTPVGPDSQQFVSKYPSLSSTLYNLLQVFDVYTWAAIIISFLSIGVAALFLAVVKSDEVDTAKMLLVPFDVNDQPFKLLGNGGYVLLVFWGFGWLLISLAFSCNLTTILLRPNYDVPIDSARDVVLQQKVMVFQYSNYLKGLFQLSPNVWNQRILERERFRNSELESFSDLLYKIGTETSDVMVEAFDSILYTLKVDPRIKAIPHPTFYFSKEYLFPYHSAFVLQKDSIWKRELDHHINLAIQAGLVIKTFRLLSDFSEADRQVEVRLTLDHLAVAFSGLLVGLFLAFLVFGCEVTFGRVRKRKLQNTNNC